MSELLGSFGCLEPMVFTATLSKINEPLTSFGDPAHLLRYLRTDHPQANRMFLITPDDVEMTTRRILMQDGSGTKIKADQPFNPDAVLIRLGGELDGVLIATSINTTGETPIAMRTYKLLKSQVVKRSRYVDGFYVLPGAFGKLKSGWRLTPDPGFARSEDLKVTES